MISLQKESLASIRIKDCWPCMTLLLPPLSSMYHLGIKTTLENKVQALFTKTWSPHAVLSLTFWLNFHLQRGGSSSLLILPGLLRSDRGGLSVSSPSGEWEDACGVYRWSKSLSWNFISFPFKPSYSGSFLHWIFSLSYPYLTTLYIFNSIIFWSLKLSPLRIPWIHLGWTPTRSHPTDQMWSTTSFVIFPLSCLLLALMSPWINWCYTLWPISMRLSPLWSSSHPTCLFSSSSWGCFLQREGVKPFPPVLPTLLPSLSFMEQSFSFIASPNLATAWILMKWPQCSPL